MYKKEIIEACSQYWDIVTQNVDSSNFYLDYEQFEPILSNFEGNSSTFVPFKVMADDYTRSLINMINTFCSYLDGLSAWSKILKQYSENQRAYLRFEFVDPVLFFCLNQPYALRNRFVFTSSRLLHESNSVKDSDWKDDLPDDKDIGFKTLKRVGEKWEKFGSFVNALIPFNDEEFRKNTSDYRHECHHRISSNFEVGIASIVLRTREYKITEQSLERLREKEISEDIISKLEELSKQDYVSKNKFVEYLKRRIEDNQAVISLLFEYCDRRVAYQFIGKEPLTLDELIPLLYSEHSKAVRVFHSFWELLKEQLECWRCET